MTQGLGQGRRISPSTFAYWNWRNDKKRGSFECTSSPHTHSLELAKCLVLLGLVHLRLARTSVLKSVQLVVVGILSELGLVEGIAVIELVLSFNVELMQLTLNCGVYCGHRLQQVNSAKLVHLHKAWRRCQKKYNIIRHEKTYDRIITRALEQGTLTIIGLKRLGYSERAEQGQD
jgi:hypothetical protein